MSKCLLDPQFKNISGRVGNILFRTYTKPDGTKETRAYGLPRRSKQELNRTVFEPLSNHSRTIYVFRIKF